ncbi:iron ABC transporter substrate-binding protein [Wohlfahrtiimonas chitiniclastica]|uniref:iron ABC transporter substrate-binding protein n=1 Tax=Wohlfahrtiimonas chitiniclastica TaxID=400946 RepID=UPI001BCD0889|nr:iron ABC transporter substrate-binding protein [Wohlfahrtiimonas chitiniclastica]MBS7827735.1 iron ABC transporter substrate-binding protein [Wohlfahrtiimonas chitiniclastica]
MHNRRSFLKSILATALMAHCPALVWAKSRDTSLLQSFGALPKADSVQRILSAGPVADVLLMSLAPEKLLGLSTRPLSKMQQPFFSPKFRDLPLTGRLAGKGSTLSFEKIIALKPDIIVDIGSISATYVTTAERVHQQTKVTYVLMDGTLKDSPEQLSTLGDILGVSERGDQLANYATQMLDRTHLLAKSSQLPEMKVYSARGADGLETGLGGSIHTEVLDWVGAHNVAAAAGDEIIARVSMEQLMLWQPNVIITMDPEFHAKIYTLPLWQRLNAVKNRRVYLAPTLPYGWLDRPPSINRLLGTIWLSRVLYPELMPYDEYAEWITGYFKHFYQYDLTDEALSMLSGDLHA